MIRSISFEFFPPKTPKLEAKLWQSIERLAPIGPKFVSVTYGAGGSTRTATHKIVKTIISDTDLNAAAHLTCVSASKEEVDSVIDDYKAIGVNHIVALRGDMPEMPEFLFPQPTPLVMTMSDVWAGSCSREVGFTLRVGGKGSGINDRRNWDAYMVDGEERTLSPQQGLRMMGFPEDFKFSVSNNQAMKQLGNSVAVNAVKATAEKIVDYLDENSHFFKEVKQKEVA